MSTILKSLKKLEQEKEATLHDAKRPSYSGPGSMHMHDTRSFRIKSTWVKRTFLVVVIVVLCSTSVYYYMQSRDNTALRSNSDRDTQQQIVSVAKANTKEKRQKALRPDTKEVQSIPQHKKELPVSQHPKTTINPTSSSKRRLSQPETKKTMTPPQPHTRKTVNPPQPVAEHKENPVKPALAYKAKPTPKKKVTSPKPKSKISPQPIQKPPKKKPTDPYAGTMVLKDGRLKIQAIVWSVEREDRMAVINTRIIHEGDSVNNFTVLAIRPDDVIVRESGQGTWRVIFGRP